MTAKKNTVTPTTSDPIKKTRKTKAPKTQTDPVETPSTTEPVVAEDREIPTTPIAQSPPKVTPRPADGSETPQVETPPVQAPKAKKLSALEAAVRVLGESGQAMNCQELIRAMAAKGFWSSPKGRTPASTLYSALRREVHTKGEKARLVKSERGKFAPAWWLRPVGSPIRLRGPACRGLLSFIGVWSGMGRPDTTWANGGDPLAGRAGHAGSRRQELTPQTALLAPIHHGGDGHQIGQDDRIAAALGRRQKQQRFLEVRGQIQQVHDLAHPRPRHMTQRRQRAIIADLTRPNQAIESQRQAPSAATRAAHDPTTPQVETPPGCRTASPCDCRGHRGGNARATQWSRSYSCAVFLAMAAEHLAGQRLQTQGVKRDRYLALRSVIVHARYQQMHHAGLLGRSHRFPGRIQSGQRSRGLRLIQPLLLHRFPLRP